MVLNKLLLKTESQENYPVLFLLNKHNKESYNHPQEYQHSNATQTLERLASGQDRLIGNCMYYLVYNIWTTESRRKGECNNNTLL